MTTSSKTNKEMEKLLKEIEDGVDSLWVSNPEGETAAQYIHNETIWEVRQKISEVGRKYKLYTKQIRGSMV